MQEVLPGIPALPRDPLPDPARLVLVTPSAEGSDSTRVIAIAAAAASLAVIGLAVAALCFFRWQRRRRAAAAAPPAKKLAQPGARTSSKATAASAGVTSSATATATNVETSASLPREAVHSVAVPPPAVGPHAFDGSPRHDRYDAEDDSFQQFEQPGWPALDAVRLPPRPCSRQSTRARIKR